MIIGRSRRWPGVLPFLFSEGHLLEAHEGIKEHFVVFEGNSAGHLEEGELAHETGDEREDILHLGIGADDIDELLEQGVIGDDPGVLAKKAMEGAAAGLEIEASLVTREGEEGGNLGEGVFLAKAEDVLLVFGGEGGEVSFFCNHGCDNKEGGR